MRPVPSGDDRLREAQLRALGQAPLGLRSRAQAPGEADLAEARRRRADGRRACAAEAIASAIREVGAGLVDAHAAGDVDEDVGRAEREPAWRPRTATIIARRFGIDAGRRPGAAWRDRSARRAPGSRAGAAACPRARTRRPSPAARSSARPKSSDGSATPTRPVAGHLEDAELVRRAEAVLHRAQDAVRAVAVALELEHAVDEVLEHARPGDRAVLRHVADEEDRDAALLGDAQEPRGRLAHLGDRAGRGAELGRVERLDRVDHRNVGPLALERRADRRRGPSPRGSRRPARRRAGRRGASPAPPTPRR